MHPYNAYMSSNNPNQDVIAINPNAKFGQMSLAAKMGVGYYCSRGGGVLVLWAGVVSFSKIRIITNVYMSYQVQPYW